MSRCFFFPMLCVVATLACGPTVHVIRSPGPPRPAHDGDVAVRFLQTPPGALEIARIDAESSGPELPPALEPLVEKTAALGGNLIKVDSVESSVSTSAALDNKRKRHLRLRIRTRVRGRAFFLPQNHEVKP